MRAVVDRLQGPAPQPPGRVALGGRLRLGTGPARRGAPVPDVAQPLAGICGPEGDQFQTPDVTGESNQHMMGGFKPPPGYVFHCMHCTALLPWGSMHYLDCFGEHLIPGFLTDFEPETFLLQQAQLQRHYQCNAAHVKVYSGLHR